MNDPQISVIVPVYNTAQFLPRCIESILSQTFKSFELILIDDGSFDDSGNICDKYATQNKRIKTFHQNNSGANWARKKGVDISIGEYITFVDSDDTLPLNALELLIEKIINDKVDIVIGVERLENTLIQTYNEKTGIYDNIEYAKMIMRRRSPTGPVCRLIKRSLFDSKVFSIEQGITSHEDMFMNFILALNANKVSIYNDIVVYNYYPRLFSARTVIMKQIYWEMLFTNYEKILNENNLLKEFEKDLMKYQISSLFSNVRKIEKTDWLLQFQKKEWKYLPLQYKLLRLGIISQKVKQIYLFGSLLKRNLQKIIK